MNSMRGTIRRYLAALMAIVMIAVSVGAFAEDVAVDSGEPAATVETEVKQESKPAQDKAAASEKKEKADKTPEKAKDEADEKAGDADKAPETKPDEKIEAPVEKIEDAEKAGTPEEAGSEGTETEGDPEKGEDDPAAKNGTDDAQTSGEATVETTEKEPETTEDGNEGETTDEDAEDDSDEDADGEETSEDEEEELSDEIDPEDLVARDAEESIYDESGKLKDGTYSVNMTAGSSMYKLHPDDMTATADLVVSGGSMRIHFTLKSDSSFGKLSLSDPESAESYYVGSVGKGTTYCVPLGSLDGLSAYLAKQDGKTWNKQTTFTLNKDSIEKVSDSTSSYSLSATEKAAAQEEEEESIYDESGNLKDGTYSVDMTAASNMYKLYPDAATAKADLVVSGGSMRVHFTLKSKTSFSKLSLSDPESAEEYYVGAVGDGTTYCVPLGSLDGLSAYFVKQDGETWNGQTTFTFNKDSIEKVSDSTSDYPLSATEKAAQEEESIYDESGNLKDGTYSVDMTAASNMYKLYPDTATATADLVVSGGSMRVHFTLKSETSFGKLSLSDPESAEEYYVGAVGDGTTYCVPLGSLDGLSAYFVKQDGETWNGKTSFAFDKDSIEKVSDSTSDYPLSATEKAQEEEPEEPSGEQTDVETGAAMFKVAACTVYIKGDELRAKVTLSGTGSDKLFAGTKAEAEAASQHIDYESVDSSSGKEQYVFDVPVSALDTPVPFASHGASSDKWFDRAMTFKSDKLSEDFLKEIEEKTGVKPAEEEPEEPSGEQTDVETGAAMFKVAACTVYIKGDELRAKVTLSGTGSDKLFAGTKAEAEAASQHIDYESVDSSSGKEQYVFDVPVSALDTPVPFASHGASSDKWFDRTMTFKSDKLSEDFLKEVEEKTGVKPASVSDDEKTDDEKKDEEQYSDTVGGSTSAVNNSTGLADGTYKPDSFSFSGGTGKVSISCSKITVRGGKTYATITFSSPNYPYVKAGGQTIYGSHGGSTSTFEIPVALNQNNRILGMTTAMSANHEVEYTIYVGLKAALAAANTASDAEADEKAEITGLRLVSKDKLKDAKLFSIYRYEDGFVMIDVVDAGRTLLVPEGAEVPVGLEDEVTLVQLPVEQAWIASEGAKALIDAAIEDTGDEALRERLANLEADPLEPDYAALMMASIDLVVLPTDFTDTDDRTEAAELVLERLDTLGIPAFVDRSLDEETEEARAEWIKVYAELLK